MIKLSDVKAKAARKNPEGNNRLHFFASKFSIYFSWIFINLGLNANQVTGVFFVTGLIGAYFISSPDLMSVIIGYSLWRLHIIFDLCDGDVARFTQKFSINGAYWDYMIHSILYPVFFISISYAQYMKFDDVMFLLIGLGGSVIVSQLLAVKNNYYRAMLFNKKQIDTEQGKNTDSDKKYLIKNAVISLLSYEGFLFSYLVSSIFLKENVFFKILLCFYLVIFTLIVLVKFLSFSKKGYYDKRS